MNRLQGKVCVITGGTSGFGFATAHLFVQEGATVIIAARDERRGNQTIRELQERTGKEVRFVRCDVCKEGEVKNLVRQVMDLHRRIDIWVNNAGVLIRKAFEETSEQEWDEVMATNLKGVFFCCKEVLPLMAKQGRGSLVNISSEVSLVGKGDVAVYSTSKAGVTILTKSLALRYAKNNVRINAICPGTIITNMNRAFFVDIADQGQRMKELVEHYPLGRLGTPEDVAYAALFLASDEAQWITGVALPVDGGYTAGKE